MFVVCGVVGFGSFVGVVFCGCCFGCDFDWMYDLVGFLGECVVGYVVFKCCVGWIGMF